MPEKQSAPSQEPGTACREKRGTNAGYQRHRRRSEKSCADCLKGHSAAVSARYRSVGYKKPPPTVKMERELFEYLWFHTPEAIRKDVEDGIRPKSFLREFRTQ
ncbi:hypothetical protein AB0E01_22750 [Nocardia vinacea]|uniref:hypothetical protein n=1 Tax=Nocardia vinacea TaxID=96468 RepID=UPI0033CFB04F